MTWIRQRADNCPLIKKIPTGHVLINMSSSVRQGAQVKLPARWPKDVHYLRSFQFHASVTPVVRNFIMGNPLIAGQLPVTYRSCVAIRPISNPAHPAYGQYGLFATSHIKPNTRFLDYTGMLTTSTGYWQCYTDGVSFLGEVHCDDRPASDYDLCLHRFPDGVCIGIDAQMSGNEARFINDYRGISDKPNALFRDDRVSSGELRMSVWSSTEGIRKGDEIVISYGKSWWRARSNS